MSKKTESNVEKLRRLSKAYRLEEFEKSKLKVQEEIDEGEKKKDVLKIIKES